MEYNWFFILILYHTILLDALISCSSFFCRFDQIFYIDDVICELKTALFLSFSSRCLLFLFLALLWPFSTVLNGSAGSRHPCLFLNLRWGGGWGGRITRYLTIKNNVSCRFLVEGFYQFKDVSFYSYFAGNFYCELF